MARILIAEDEPNIRSLIRLTLDSGRVEIVEVGDGLSAIESAREQAPDLVFLDWGMPGRSGIEVCKALRDHPDTARTRIVMITARTQPEDRLAGLAAGVDDFLTKPFSPLQLLDKVSEALGPEVLAE
jgi:two-component system phosphate regulon response regulator PhoB